RYRCMGPLTDRYVDLRDGGPGQEPWRRCEKNSERGVEPDTERAGAERRDLIATDGERRAQREAVAHFIGKVGQTHRDTEIVATDARRQPGVEIVALRLAELGSDTKARTAD